MSDIMKDNGQNSNPGNSQEDHLTGDGQPDRRFKEVRALPLCRLYCQEIPTSPVLLFSDSTGEEPMATKVAV